MSYISLRLEFSLGCPAFGLGFALGIEVEESSVIEVGRTSGDDPADSHLRNYFKARWYKTEPYAIEL